jgi:hypothetical protein
MPAGPIAKFIRGILLAAAIGGVGFAALPAAAAPVGDAYPIVVAHHRHHVPRANQRHHLHPRPHFVRPHLVRPYVAPRYYYYAPPYRAVCMSSTQLRRSVARRGYRGVSILNVSGKLAQLTAHRGRGEYVITLNRCTGTIVNVRRRF